MYGKGTVTDGQNKTINFWEVPNKQFCLQNRQFPLFLQGNQSSFVIY